MHLFKAAKKEVSEREAAVAAVAAAEAATVESLKSQMFTIAKTFTKITTPPSITVLVATSKTITLSWLTPSWQVDLDKHVAEASDLVCRSSTPANEASLECGVCYEVRYYKTGQSLTSWITIKNIEECRCTIKGLASNTSYTFEVRANLHLQAKGYPISTAAAAAAAATSATSATSGASKDDRAISVPKAVVPRCFGSKWSDWDTSTNLKTLSSERDERNAFSIRLAQYLDQNLEPYPPYVRIDTAYDKVDRVGDATLQTLSKVPFLGSYGAAVKAAKTLWDVRKIGIVSLVFSQELAQVAAVLSGLASSVRSDTGLSAKDMTVGAYYLLWIRRGIRLVNPMHEYEEHLPGVVGVLSHKAPDLMLRELAWYAPLAFASYGNTPDHVQWLVNRHPKRKNLGFELIASSPWSSRVTTEKGVYKPAYNIMAHRELGIAVLSVRGSGSIEDFLADADANLVTDVELCGVKGSVHGGMWKSAQWLSEEGGVSSMIKELHDAGHEKIVFTGHSLGAGVALLLALLAKSKYGVDLSDVSVYGYAMPACVDEGIADEVCGCGVGHVGDGVVVRSLVNKDDIVSRLSVANATELALEIQASCVAKQK